ncbi:hypothetical protein BWQ96_07673 [Gracilariopsis chorda]|uniref:Pherophorin domain-containing protein n=1 Tax=Gracilariopsis chorda TaxID=448386 RepID=A0A2V3IKK6_9FLOR|nr:hypothetical protein BWQ96_07673 [Gracilariopsis chorda]|eukprot:PXF42578.1 hypothetical protein BWQ96_07673 [Gracilariopsis chorda]
MSIQNLSFTAQCIALLLIFTPNISDGGLINHSHHKSATSHPANRAYYLAYPVILPPKSSSSGSFAVLMPSRTPPNALSTQDNSVNAPRRKPSVLKPTASQPFKTTPRPVSVPRGVIRNSFIFRTSADCATTCRAYVQSALISNPGTADCKVNKSFVNIGRVNLGFIRCSMASSRTGVPISPSVIANTIRTALAELNIRLIDVENDRTFKLQ